MGQSIGKTGGKHDQRRAQLAPPNASQSTRNGILELALLGGGLSGLATAQDIEGRSRLLGEDIAGQSRIQGERDLAAMKRQTSQQDFRMSLQEMINDAEVN